MTVLQKYQIAMYHKSRAAEYERLAQAAQGRDATLAVRFARRAKKHRRLEQNILRSSQTTV